MKTYRQIYYLLSPKERRKGILVILLTLLTGVVEVLGAASILPFLTLLGNNNVIESNIFLFYLRDFTGITNRDDFLFFVGILLFFILLFSLIIKALSNYVLLKYCALREYTLSKRLLKLYLVQPYAWFISKNSSDVAKNILSESAEVIREGLTPMMNLISGLILASSMLLLIFIFTPNFALIFLLVLFTSYLTIYKLFKNILNKTGEEKLNSNKERFISINEVFGAVKQVKLSGLEDQFIKKYSSPAYTFANSNAKARIIDSSPKYFVEAIGFGGMLLAILYLMKTNGEISKALPSIGLCAYAGYRLLPSLQLIYQSISRLKYAGPSVENLYNDFKRLTKTKQRAKNCNKIFPKRSINIKDLNFRYLNKNSFSLKDINLEIKAQNSTGFVGLTGSGKTTLIDIILGLLQPDRGSIFIDKIKITKNNRFYWQDSIGYVPQNIYLSDDSIAANIAFGVEKSKIDYGKVKKFAKLAEIDEFIENLLPNGYETFVGERGTKLSGGQMQRIGIARALYMDPNVLILDEATSALDNITEMKLMNNIYNLQKKITIIIIAHRLSTLRNCDQIHLLEKGRILESGKYDELLKKSKIFKKMNSLEINQFKNS